MIPPLDPGTGMLPLGRHRCTEGEVEAAFVTAPAFAASTTRTEIWDHWQQGLRLLQSACTVHLAWLGGSFTTAKPDPDDLDVTFLINGMDMRSRSLAEKKIITVFEGRGRVKSALGLRLDSYVVPWECVPQPGPPGFNGVGDPYFWARGQWDDWWQRQRVTAKGSTPTPADAPPRRGYLEVPFSDYP